MPCLAMHLAVAKEYLKKHPEEDEEEFILGTIAPDIDMPGIEKYINGVGTEKNSHHFGENYNTTDPIEYMKRKVNFKKFFDHNEIDTSFKRAYFLHLICDYAFFGEYITHSDLYGMTQEEVKEKGYRDYNRITPVLIQKYNLVIPKSIEQIVSGHSEGKLEILDEDNVYKFINDMVNVDIYEYRKNILS